MRAILASGWSENAEGCGAGDPGNPGFQEGNTCGREGSSIDMTPGGGSKTVKIGRTTIIYGVASDSASVEVDSVRTPTKHRGQGSARAAMQALLQETDKRGMTVRLVSSPLDKRTSDAKLEAFYHSLGFRRTGKTANIVGDPWMERKPEATINAAPKRRPNPLRADPTRTASIRRRFTAGIRGRYRRIVQALRRALLEHNVLQLTENASDCGAGEEGNPGFQPGNTCRGIRLDKTRMVDPNTLEFREEHQEMKGVEERFKDQEIDLPVVTILEEDGTEKILDGHHRTRLAIDRGVKLPVVSVTRGEYDRLFEQYSEMEIAYGALMRAGEANAADELDRQFSGVQDKGLDAYNDLTTNAPRYVFRTTPERLAAFVRWLQRMIEAELIDATDPYERDAYWRTYVEEGFRQGQGRAWDDVHKVMLRERVAPWYEGSREEFLRSAFAQPVAVDRVKLLAGRVFTDLQGISQWTATQMNRSLSDSMAQGEGAVDAMRRLVETAKLSEERALLVARTEIVRAHSEGQLYAMEQMGVAELGVAVEWDTAHDDRVCQKCADLQGIVVKTSEAHGMIPRHPNCLVGETSIHADGLLAAMRAVYTGDIFHIRTASGGKVSVTANHILLSEFGFVPANLLYEGLNLLDTRGAYTAFGNVSNGNHRVALVEEVFQTLSLLGDACVSRGTMGVDFHGDGQSLNAEVRVVGTGSVLRNEANLGLGAERIEKQLPSVHLAEIDGRLPFGSSLTQFLKRVSDAFDGSMGRFREFQALLLGRLLHAKQHRVSSVSGLDTGVLQAFVDDVAANLEEFRESIRAHPILKQFTNFGSRDLQAIARGEAISILTKLRVNSCFPQVLSDRILWNPKSLRDFSCGSSRLVHADCLGMRRFASSGKSPTNSFGLSNTQVDSGFLEPIPDRASVNTVDFSKFSSSFSGLVELDQVVDVFVEHVENLPVYDVETQSSLILAGNITQSQCRCSWIPANVGESERGQIRSKSGIDDAIAEAAGEKTTWAGADADIDRDRPESGL
jgi:predicted GNAT family acetyltransferase